MKNSEDLKEEIARFIGDNSQFELCQKMLNEYAEKIIWATDPRTSTEDMMSAFAQAANIQHNLGYRMRSYPISDVGLMVGLLRGIMEETNPTIKKVNLTIVKK